ncbi:hypothetical protein F0U61_08380 [Archangium violaceum]|uniref:hypothetical protein n=1 Tax=Archangium violaceum TaxID=83451 RepID=UPI002B29B83A|nr:hypothetical protein F0U61_08380 [Archangium violaceum]
MNTGSMLLTGLLLLAVGCSHGSREVAAQPGTAWESSSAYDAEPEEGVRIKGNTVSARIWVLINNGRFAEAEALIAEATASGLVTAPTATRMMEKIALLNMRVGQIPATLQRARDFPSQLKDYTLFEVRQMLERRDFSLATEAQLKMVSKILKNPERLMEKL